MTRTILGLACALAIAASPLSAQETVEVEVCRASGLIALSEKDASIKNLVISQEGLTIAKADAKVEDTPIKTVIIGEAYLMTDKSDKPRTMLCLISDKGKVVLTFFTQR